MDSFGDDKKYKDSEIWQRELDKASRENALREWHYPHETWQYLGTHREIVWNEDRSRFRLEPPMTEAEYDALPKCNDPEVLANLVVIDEPEWDGYMVNA